MPSGPTPFRRRSLRLRGYDYSRTNAYFVTMCTHDRACLFGKVVESEARLNEVGRHVCATWEGLPDHYPHVRLDTFVVMPNHVHGILILETVGAGEQPGSVGPVSNPPLRQPSGITGCRRSCVP